jgi:hypothetical protein
VHAEAAGLEIEEDLRELRRQVRRQPLEAEEGAEETALEVADPVAPLEELLRVGHRHPEDVQLRRELAEDALHRDRRAGEQGVLARHPHPVLHREVEQVAQQMPGVQLAQRGR